MLPGTIPHVIRERSKPWDFSTFSDIPKNSISTTYLPVALTFSPNGKKCFISWNAAISLGVACRNLSTAWNLSTMSTSDDAFFDPDDFDEGGYIVRDIKFSTDGLTLYLLFAGNNTIKQFTLTSPWDITTVSSYVGESSNLVRGGKIPRGFWLTAGRSQAYITNSDSYHQQYPFGTAGVISTISYATRLQSPGSDLRAIAISADGIDVLLLDSSGTGKVLHRKLNTAFYYPDGSVLSSTAALNLGSSHRPLGMFMREDGIKLYICGYGPDYTSNFINQYNL